MDWPDHFPPSCPPAEADDACQTVYRFLNNKRAKAKDFKSYYDIDVHKFERGVQDSLKDWGDLGCKARGLSVYTEISHCRVAMDLNPSMRRKFLGELVLDQSDRAEILKTPSRVNPEHHTIWMPNYANLEGRCKQVSDVVLKEGGASDD